jgi:hypothetical protein
MTLQGTVQNGVIVMDHPVQVPEGARVEIRIQEKLQGSTPLREILLRHAGKALDLPEDMAEQHDHYLHGTPKR